MMATVTGLKNRLEDLTTAKHSESLHQAKGTTESSMKGLKKGISNIRFFFWNLASETKNGYHSFAGTPPSLGVQEGRPNPQGRKNLTGS